MSNETETAKLLGGSPPNIRAKEYWRSLEELAGTEQFKELIQNELPRHAAAWSGAG